LKCQPLYICYSRTLSSEAEEFQPLNRDLQGQELTDFPMSSLSKDEEGGGHEENQFKTGFYAQWYMKANYSTQWVELRAQKVQKYLFF
jgi:hypothetical protein